MSLGSCDACRAYHYKCDDLLPSCGRCAKVGRRCKRSEKYRFKATEVDSESFPESQEWVEPPQKVVFVDENAKVKDEYELKASESIPETVTPWQVEPLPTGKSEVATSPSYSSYTTTTVTTHTSKTVEDESQDPVWPVASEQEALLIRHFADVVAHFFDFCDPKRHFARLVPQRARKSSILASAVLALSARHLSRVSTFDALVADEHYNVCLQQLIPALAESAKDDSLLAAIVILRLMEEIDVPITGRDSQNHLVGTQAIVRAQEQKLRSPSDSSGLLEQAHWAALRQDLYMSLTAQRPMQLSSLDLVRSVYQAKHDLNNGTSGDEQDAEWSNLSVLQCCDVCQFAFGPNNRDINSYNHLKTANEHWRGYKPISFDPFYSRRESVNGLPDIKLLADWHVMGYMYNLLAQLLLIVYNPEIPQIGPSRIRATQLTDEDARRTVWEMAGIAVSNHTCGAAMLVASMAIAMCGDRFTRAAERETLQNILRDTEMVQGWPTRAAWQALQRVASHDS